MQVVTRRLIVISAIAVFGAAAGLALGHFVAGPEAIGGGATNAMFGLDTGLVSDARNVADNPDFAAAPGPTSYSCQGCDAHLHNDMTDGNGVAPADAAPLPPYRSEDATIAPRAAAGLPVRRDAIDAAPRLPASVAPASTPDD